LLLLSPVDGGPQTTTPNNRVPPTLAIGMAACGVDAAVNFVSASVVGSLFGVFHGVSESVQAGLR
jgi:hypothetical protein